MRADEHHRRWYQADLATAAVFVGAVLLWRWQPELNLLGLLVAAALVAGLLNFAILHLPHSRHERPPVGRHPR